MIQDMAYARTPVGTAKYLEKMSEQKNIQLVKQSLVYTDLSSLFKCYLKFYSIHHFWHLSCDTTLSLSLFPLIVQYNANKTLVDCQNLSL